MRFPSTVAYLKRGGAGRRGVREGRLGGREGRRGGQRGVAGTVPGGVAVMGFKAKSGPVPRSPSVKDSPEPSRGSRAKHTEADTGPGLSVGYCPKWR